MAIRIVTSIMLCLNVIFIYAIIKLKEENIKLKSRKTLNQEKNELKHTILELQESFKEKSIEAYLYKDKLDRIRKLFRDDKRINDKLNDIETGNIYQDKE